MQMKYALYPITIARGQNSSGWEDEDFDISLLPLEIVAGVTIEDMSQAFAEDEFEIARASGLGTRVIKELQRIRHAITYRFPQNEVDPATNTVDVDSEQAHRSVTKIREIAACLRLIRPTQQYVGLLQGDIVSNGKFKIQSFDTPDPHADVPMNQRLFSIRTQDAKDLQFYAPLLIDAMHKPYWKFRMAVQLYEAAHFQYRDWKVHFFLCSSALEALYTTQSKHGQNSGSKVASGRIKSLIGGGTSIYPPGELLKSIPNPGYSVNDVIGEIYCLRNHIAHGDKVPDYYFALTGRDDINTPRLNRFQMLTEAISFIVRRSILTILKDGLLSDFADASSSDAYFLPKGLTKDGLKKAGINNFTCPA
jgi:hypothetical protein